MYDDDDDDFLAWTRNMTDSPDEPYDPDTLCFKHKELHVGQTFEARVQYGKSLDAFYVMTMSAFNDYLKIKNDFNDFCELVMEISSDKFKPGAIVGVKEHICAPFLRGIILEITRPNSRARVKLVDWGREIVIKKSFTRLIDIPLFTKAPIGALYCAAVPGFQPWEKGIKEFLYRGNRCSITVERVGNGFENPHIVSVHPPEQIEVLPY